MGTTAVPGLLGPDGVEQMVHVVEDERELLDVGVQVDI